MTALPVPSLLVISDRAQATRPIEEIAAAVFEAGGRWFSLREKDLPAEERRALLRALVTLGHRYGAVVTVHDDIEAAVATGAGGVHLATGASAAAARARLPAGLIGASAHSAPEAAAALRAGADYVTLSPVFASASKPGYGPALGLAALAQIVAATPGAVMALGGINAANAGLCRKAGAAGVAVMGEAMRAVDPRKAVEDILRAMPQINQERHRR